MSRIAVIVPAALSGLLCLASSAPAQQQAVFIHGLNSDPGSWEEAARRLSQILAIDPKRPKVDWRARYEDQAQDLNADADLNGTNLLIGHSNGGVVARQWARLRPFAGIVTIGTPHRGAPLMSNLGRFANYTSSAVTSMISAGQGIASLANSRQPAFGQCCDWWYVAQQALNTLSVTTGFLNYGFYGMLGGIGATVFAPVFGEMEPASGFMQDLNRPDNLAREAAAVPSRIGIISSSPFWAGLFQTFAPSQAESIGWVVKGGAWGLYLLATEIIAGTEPGDWEAWDVADRLLAAAGYLDSLDATWCAAVSSVGMQACDYNDAVVPVWSQQFPGAVNIYSGNESGPTHVRETELAKGWIEQALTQYAHVPRRADPGAGDATRLNAGQELKPGQSAASPNGRVVLTYQADGNLAVYDNGAAVWAINCWPECLEIGEAGRAMMQEDGNFVVQDSAGSVLWHTSTWGNPGAYLAIQNDGNLVVYDGSGTVLWHR